MNKKVRTEAPRWGWCRWTFSARRGILFKVEEGNTLNITPSTGSCLLCSLRRFTYREEGLRADDRRVKIWLLLMIAETSSVADEFYWITA
ncbi:MAG: hypothetical protein D4R56_00570 [Deltaproteobacteria bacterium]|nr:MAG: hypothetical protein D4R56_00570 [Deltaproteobacteria bacterium]